MCFYIPMFQPEVARAIFKKIIWAQCYPCTDRGRFGLRRPPCRTNGLVDFLVYLSLALVVLYTARLARSRACNPWVWAGAAFVLVLIPPLKLLGIAPLILLWILKVPQVEGRAIRTPDSCTECYAPQPQRSRFCTNCGTQLRTTDSDSSAVRDQAPLSTTVAEAPEPVAASEAATGTVEPESPPAAGYASAEEQAQAPTEQHEPEAKKPVSMGVPTSAGMTERGVRLFNQGRVQESIDQFTKAIALDPNYTQAWARRAEAYARLGRGEEAAEDRRRLEALNAGSSSG